MDAKPESPAPARKPGRIGVVVAVLAVLAVASGLLVLWSPWGGDGGEPKPDESTTAAPSSSPDQPTGPSRSESDQPTGGGKLKPVPTVIGMPVQQAAAEVERVFSDVRLEADANGAGETCVVFAQDPESGEFPADSPVTLTYAGTQDECLG